MARISPPKSGDTPSRQMTPRAPETASLGRAAGLGLLTSSVGLIAAIVRSKASALILGPSGVGMSAEIQQLATLALVPLSALFGPALMTALAQEKNEGAEPKAVLAAIGWALILGSGLTVFAVTALFPILPREWSAGMRPLVLLACVTTTAGALSSISVSVLTFGAALRTVARIQVTISLGTAGVVALATWLDGLRGQFVAAALASVISAVFFVKVARRSPHWPSRLGPRLDPQFLRSAMLVGVASLVAAGASQAALFAIRIRLDQLGGPGANGQFQAAWAIGSVYLGMILGGLGNFVFPRFAAARSSEELQSEVDEAAGFVMKFAPPAVLLAAGFADVGIHIMYSSRFEGAMDILRWQFAGDVAKCLSWVYAGPLLYRGKTRAFAFTELAAGVSLAGATWLLADVAGVTAPGLAYLLSYAMYLAIAMFIAHRELGVRARFRHVVLAGVGTGLAVVTAVAPWGIGRGVALVAATVWLWRAGAWRILRSQGPTKLS